MVAERRIGAPIVAPIRLLPYLSHAWEARAGAADAAPWTPSPTPKAIAAKKATAGANEGKIDTRNKL